MSNILDSVENTVCEFLASGQSAAEVAGLCGISTDRIQELLKNEEFRQMVKERGKELRNVRIEEKYAKTEEHLLNKITGHANDEMIEMSALCRALEVVAKNRVLYRNPAGFGQPPIINHNVVTLLLPPGAENQKVLMNGNAEIVAIGDRNMSGMPIDGVKEIFKNIEDKREEKKRRFDLANAKTVRTSAATG